MNSKAREWLVLVEHRGPTALSGACFEYVIIAETEKEAQKRARDKHNYRDTPYDVVASVKTPLPTNVPEMHNAEERETKRRIG